MQIIVVATWAVLQPSFLFTTGQTGNALVSHLYSIRASFIILLKYVAFSTYGESHKLYNYLKIIQNPGRLCDRIGLLLILFKIFPLISGCFLNLAPPACQLFLRRAWTPSCVRTLIFCSIFRTFKTQKEATLCIKCPPPISTKPPSPESLGESFFRCVISQRQR